MPTLAGEKHNVFDRAEPLEEMSLDLYTSPDNNLMHTENVQSQTGAST